MYQILLIPNITWQKEINQDSYIKVISDIIRELKEIRNDLFWHSPVSEPSSLLDFSNVRQYKIDFPSYPNSMRGHFDYQKWLDIIDWKNKDFDLIYSHLPEWTLNVSNLIANVTNIGTVPIIGYTHWTEIKEITNYDKTYLLNNINGLLEMRTCGVNTEAQKKLIINNVRCIYSKDTLNRLDKILTPHYLGVPNDVRETICEKPEKKIVFNHRPQAYKAFPYFLSLMEKLYKERRDFTVWIPLLGTSDKHYIDTTVYNNKSRYYDVLNRCAVCYCPKQKYAGWSVSGTDALMNGVPVLFYDADYYRELRGPSGDYHLTEQEALAFFNRMLDDTDLRNRKAQAALDFSKKILTWKNRIIPINNMINDSLASTKAVSSKSKKRNKLSEFVLRSGKVTKKQILNEMKWGVGIKFAAYRKYLIEHPDITTIVINNIEYYKSNTYKESMDSFFC